MPSAFRTPLDTRYLDGRNWMVLQPFEYAVGSLEKPREIISIPAGFVTDFASIPRILWPIYPPTGPYGKAAVVHDWLYSTEVVFRRRPRADADMVFLEGMVVLEVPWTTRHVLYRHVRMYGWLVIVLKRRRLAKQQGLAGKK